MLTARDPDARWAIGSNEAWLQSWADAAVPRSAAPPVCSASGNPACGEAEESEESPQQPWSGKAVWRAPSGSIQTQGAWKPSNNRARTGSRLTYRPVRGVSRVPPPGRALRITVRRARRPVVEGGRDRQPSVRLSSYIDRGSCQSGQAFVYLRFKCAGAPGGGQSVRPPVDRDGGRGRTGRDGGSVCRPPPCPTPANGPPRPAGGYRFRDLELEEVFRLELPRPAEELPRAVVAISISSPSSPSSSPSSPGCAISAAR